MKKSEATITNAFKRVHSIKRQRTELFAVRYKQGEYYRLFIDTADEKRQVITFTSEEFKEFKSIINNL